MTPGAVVGLVGPTAVGKSRLALEAAITTGAEILNADSRQVYRRLAVGTAKPTPEHRALVPHHLYDLAEPDEPFTLAHYLEAARSVLANLDRRGRPALLVGGTGLYVRALQRGYSPPPVPANTELRRRLEALPLEGLQRLLEERAPEAFQLVDRRNPRRLIRALEVALADTAPAAGGGRAPAGFPLVGLTMPRAKLYRRIDERAERMWKAGWIEEVRGLLSARYSPDLPAFTALGYPEVVACIRGEIDADEARRRIQLAGHRLARRQYAWFKPSDPDIAWYDVSTAEGWATARRAVESLAVC